MDENRKALSEVDVIIKNLPEKLNKKISENFKEIVEKEKDNNYKPDVNNLVIENNMLPETVVILGLIYRDYLCDESEKQKLLLTEKEELQKLNEEKYSYENLFKNNVLKENIETKEELALVEVKKKWYTKIIDFFRSKIKNKE